MKIFIFVIPYILAALLLLSLLGNLLLYRRSNYFKMQMKQVRLDPMGLDKYSTGKNDKDSLPMNLKTVVFYGDSRSESWPFPDVDGFKFINRGIGGETSAQCNMRFQFHILPLRPDYLVLQICINDLTTLPYLTDESNQLVQKCKDNVLSIVEQCRSLETKMILTTVFPIGKSSFGQDDEELKMIRDAVDEVNDYIRTLKADDVILFDAYDVLVDKDQVIYPEFAEDLLHLNDKGYEKLNDEFVKIFWNL